MSGNQENQNRSVAQTVSLTDGEEKQNALQNALQKARQKRERIRVYMAAWRNRNKERIKMHRKTYAAAHYERDSEKVKARAAAWAKANPERAKARAAAWRKANAERIKAVYAAWLEANREERRAYRKAYYERNSEAVKKAAVAWYKENTARHKTVCDAYRIANRERINMWVSAWREKNSGARLKYEREYRERRMAENPEAIKEMWKRHVHNRRARNRAAGGKLTKGITAALLFFQCDKCAACKKDLRETGYHLDHIIPISRGGKNDDANVQLLCPKCNMRKSAKPPEVFMREMATVTQQATN